MEIPVTDKARHTMEPAIHAALEKTSALQLSHPLERTFVYRIFENGSGARPITLGG
jgi:hypothetical protein